MKIIAKPAYLVYLERHVILSRITGVLAGLVALTVLISKLGVGSGLFAFGAVLMCVACLVVILAPYRYLKPAWLAGAYVGLLTLEMIFYEI